eukprot:SAG31_NODE_1763_length_7322_cov_21.697633_2_plen_94_part_00
MSTCEGDGGREIEKHGCLGGWLLRCLSLLAESNRLFSIPPAGYFSSRRAPVRSCDFSHMDSPTAVLPAHNFRLKLYSLQVPGLASRLALPLLP